MLGVSREPCQQWREHGEGSIRIVLLEENVAVQRRLQAIIAEDPAYVVVACADSWEQCEPLIGEHVPELLIASAALLPRGFSFEPSGFPLVLRLQITNDSDQPAVDRTSQEFRHELLRIRQELYSRKASELSMLLDHYLAGLNSLSYVSSVKACQAGENIEVPVAQIQMIEASGNYVRIHSAGNVLVLREAISCLQAKLDPSVFLRTHRSYLVNVQFISHLSPADGGPLLLVLSDGQTIPIGPNYRDEIRRHFEPDEKLIA